MRLGTIKMVVEEFSFILRKIMMVMFCCWLLPYKNIFTCDAVWKTIICYIYLYNIVALLSYFSTQISMTEYTLYFGLTATCYLETSSVQGVYHTGVAVVLGLLKLKNRDKTYICQSFTIYFYLVEYTLSNFELLFPLECVELAKIVYHAGVATKYLSR